MKGDDIDIRIRGHDSKFQTFDDQEVHDQKVQLDNLQHVKYQLAQQLEEARRRLEDAERFITILLETTTSSN
ncbi:hypothetical protein WR25_04868 [Diploscapter pachys]|uniref:Uncharacterized protein n=1 Tax=Diploscapter pachys TaxID=2018661 RepID=A0A2A2LXD7_9BILA|nr:hypothetical protein WR25_04868 [Diploscapter pachys]